MWCAGMVACRQKCRGARECHKQCGPQAMWSTSSRSCVHPGREANMGLCHCSPAARRKGKSCSSVLSLPLLMRQSLSSCKFNAAIVPLPQLPSMLPWETTNLLHSPAPEMLLCLLLVLQGLQLLSSKVLPNSAAATCHANSHYSIHQASPCNW